MDKLNAKITADFLGEGHDPPVCLFHSIIDVLP